MVKVTLLQDGPIVVGANSITFQIGDSEWERKTGGVVALCRCGLSAKKPFCDGAHTESPDDLPAAQFNVA